MLRRVLREGVFLETSLNLKPIDSLVKTRHRKIGKTWEKQLKSRERCAPTVIETMTPTISQQVTFIGVQRPGEVEEDPYVGRRGNRSAADVRSQQHDVSSKSNKRNNECFHPFHTVPGIIQTHTR